MYTMLKELCIYWNILPLPEIDRTYFKLVPLLWSNKIVDILLCNSFHYNGQVYHLNNEISLQCAGIFKTLLLIVGHDIYFPSSSST